MSDKMTIQQFGQTIKAKHPEYNDIPDAELGQKVLAKYPQYSDMVSTQVDHGQSKKTWLDSASDLAGELWKQINPVSNAQGAAQATSHPIQTLVSDKNARQAIMQKAEDAFKKGDYAGGMAHALYSIIPLIGPQLDRSGEQFSNGEFAKGAGSSIGIGLNLSGPKALTGAKANIKVPARVARAGTAASEEMYQSSLKPNLNNGSAKIGGMVKTGLDEGIPISQAGIEKLGSLIDDVNSKVSAEIGSTPGRSINKFSVARRLQNTADEFSKQVNPTKDLRNIAESGNDFLQTQAANIPAREAQALKVGTYQQLKGKYGELGNASIEAQKALARGLKEELSKAFPELDNLNMREAKLLDLQPSLERAITRIGNHQLIGIGTPIAGGAASAVSGSGAVGAITGVVKLIVDNPVVKSRLAIALNRASKGSITIPIAKARIQGYVNALGQAASVPNETQDQ